MKMIVSLVLSVILLGNIDPASAQPQKGPADDWEHYLFYNFVPHGPFKPRQVRLKDQFGLYEGYVLNPISLCNPVDKNGEGIKNFQRHLVCYEVNADPIGRFPTAIDVITANQFTEQSMTAIIPPKTLCVPSKKEILQ